MLALAVSEYEELLIESTDGVIGTLEVFDHDWMRGRGEDFGPDDSDGSNEPDDSPKSRWKGQSRRQRSSKGSRFCYLTVRKRN